MENINKIIKTKINKLNSSNQEFKDIFNIIHDLENNVFSEISDGYKNTSYLFYKIGKNATIKNIVFDFKIVHETKQIWGTRDGPTKIEIFILLS